MISQSVLQELLFILEHRSCFCRVLVLLYQLCLGSACGMCCVFDCWFFIASFYFVDRGLFSRQEADYGCMNSKAMAEGIKH